MVAILSPFAKVVGLGHFLIFCSDLTGMLLTFQAIILKMQTWGIENFPFSDFLKRSGFARS
jgi:hypothetical protein